MRRFILILMCLISIQLIAQTTFQKTYLSTNYDYSYGREIIQTSDGGYATIGNVTYPITYDSDILLHKYDANGTIIWSKTYGGTLDEYGKSIQQTTDGGYIITGFKEQVSADDFYIIRTNNVGDTIWTKAITGNLSGESGHSIIETSTGDFAACGFTTGYGAGGSDVYIVKLNSSGSILWTKTYGAANSDEGNKIMETSDGGYIVAGKSINSISYYDDAFILKTDINGNLIWNKTYGTSSNDDRAEDIYQLPSPDKGFIIVGDTYSAGLTLDFYVTKTDSLGVELWSYAYNGGGTDYANSVCPNGTGGFLIAGSTYSFGGDDELLLNIDANGNIIWSKTYGIPGSAYARSIIPTSDGGFVFSGELSDNVLLVKTDASGNSGCNQNNVTLTRTAISNVTNSNFSEMSGGVEYYSPIVVGTPSTTENTICLSVSIEEQQDDFIITIYPNPFSTSTTIKFENVIGETYRLDVFNYTGKLVRSITNIADNQVTLNKENLNSGIYLVQLKNGSGLVYTEKMVIK
jgi:Secretion system C-terminal sorting domain